MAVLCRVCLRSDRLTYAMNNTVLQEVWEKLTNTKLCTKNGKPLQVCFLCCAHLKKAHQLMQRALKAEVLLTLFINNGLQHTHNAISKISNLTHDFDYGYVIEYESEEITSEVTEIKKENEDNNVEVYVVHIKQEEEDLSRDDNRSSVDVKPEMVAGTELPPKKLIRKELPGRKVESDLEKIDLGNPMKKRKSENEDVQAENMILQNETAHTEVISDKSAKNEIGKQNLLKNSSGIVPNSSLDKDNEGNKSSNRNKEQLKADLSCHICQYNCVKKSDLSNHLRKHTKEKPYMCDLCDYRSSYKYTLKNHLKSNHTKEKNFSCHICQYKCDTKINLNKHLRKHTKEKPYVCDLCPYRFSLKNSLEYHIKYKHTNEKNFPCHIQYKHVDDKKYSCHLCQYKCITRSKLNIHIRTHTKEKPYMCYLCAYRFSHKNSLERHIQHKHTKEKKFSCHICQHKFVTKSNLSIHLRTHTDDKPFTCGLCNYKCLQKSNLNRHMQFKHTNEKNFSCHICQYKFVTRANLSKHLRKHTKEQPPYACERKRNLQEDSDL